MKKLEKLKYPDNHSSADFEAFGPTAVEDGNFSNCKIADLGSFSQDEKDSNKYFHVAVVKSRINKNWYTYMEWGRVGAKVPQFQFIECSSENEAQKVFADKCHEKNDKRGIWETIAGIKTLAPKKGKDVYLVRNLATRSTGLPDAKKIKTNDSTAAPKIIKSTSSDSASIDAKSRKLLDDLYGGTVSYTKGIMADDSIPSQSAISQGYQILDEAKKIIGKIGPSVDDQIKNKDLRKLSTEIYSRIPKKKALNTPDSVWILSQDNILMWENDLNAFESALSSQSTDDEVKDTYSDLNLSMNWIDPNTELGKFLYSWWPNATANKHYSVKSMNIKNIWAVNRNDEDKSFNACQEKLKNTKFNEMPLFQPKKRIDLDENQSKIYESTNTRLLFHGSRSVNISGILKTGFRNPKELTNVSITGAMFGTAVCYTADDWKKSAGYTSIRGSFWSRGDGAIAKREAFMFAVDTVLGNPFVAPGPRGYAGPPKGHHCVFGKGSNHDRYKNSGVENNEWVIFDKSQIKIRYLLEFSV